MIEARNLYKYYGNRKAAGPLSFSIAQGEIVGLLGLNGAGKTTTLRILSCDLLPSSGTVVVDGHDVVDEPDEVRRRVGYLPDSPPLYGEMRVHDFLVFAAQLRGLSKSEARARAHEVARSTDIVDVAGDPIATLSHGYRQRVGIAQAIVHRPRLLILDEPIFGLDPMQIVGMRELLRGLRGSYTIVLSSHILSEISEVCDRLLVIRNGEIAASGTEAELSTQLLRGYQIDVLVRGKASESEAIAKGVAGVRRVELASPAEVREGEVALRVEAESDVRAQLVRSLVQANIDVVGVSRAQHELESIFIQLAGRASAEGSSEPAGSPVSDTSIAATDASA